jgi:hypothetical protein
VIQILKAFAAGLLYELAIAMTILLGGWLIQAGEAQGWGAVWQACVGALGVVGFLTLTTLVGTWVLFADEHERLHAGDDRDLEGAA